MDEELKNLVTPKKHVYIRKRSSNAITGDFEAKDGTISSQVDLQGKTTSEKDNGLAGSNVRGGETIVSLDPKTPEGNQKTTFVEDLNKKSKKVVKKKKYRPKVIAENKQKKTQEHTTPKQETKSDALENVNTNKLSAKRVLKFPIDIDKNLIFNDFNFPHDLKRKRMKRKKNIQFPNNFKHFSLIRTKKKRSKRIPRRYLIGSITDCGEIVLKVLVDEVEKILKHESDGLVNNACHAEQKENDMILYVENTEGKQCCTTGARGQVDEEINSSIEKLKNSQNHDPEIMALVPYQKKHRVSGKIDLDTPTKDLVRAIKNNNLSGLWKVLQITDGKDRDSDEENDRWWQSERDIFAGRIQCFIHRMHLIQGDKRFSPWKGSVVDSVIGVFLTQNVSDHLSSSAYMSLAAKYPPVQTTNNLQETKLDDNNPKEQCSREKEDIKKVEEVMTTKVENNVNIDERGKGKAKRKRISKQTSYTDEDWKKLRSIWEPIWKRYSSEEPRSIDRMDSINWEAVMCADLKDIAQTIKKRGQHNEIAERIKDCLELVWKICGTIDLEWLRNAPPEIVEQFLKEIYGLGIKSRECIRLLSLHHAAFPVDTNVGRIAVRLGWVPLQALPDGVPIHSLEVFPLMDSIQEYLWPRLCKLDQETLYELHYQMITFGKAFCTKSNPNCNACPMKSECKHFASATASERLALPTSMNATTNNHETTSHSSRMLLEYNSKLKSQCDNWLEHIDELSLPPELECMDIEDYDFNNYEDIPTIKPDHVEDNTSTNDDMSESVHLWPRVKPLSFHLDNEASNTKSQIFFEDNNFTTEDMSGAMIPLSPRIASLPPNKLKYASRLRTEHEAYELPDLHPLLNGLETREPDDPCPYLLVIWPEESESLYQTHCNTGNLKVPVEEGNCSLSDNNNTMKSSTIGGTILIPCRTAMRGSFPLNGTYFQVNELFADDASSQHSISVPRKLIWNLPQRTVYCGPSLNIITRGLDLDCIEHCFNQGFVCVRGFDRATREPKQLVERLHTPPLVAAKQKTKKSSLQ